MWGGRGGRPWRRDYAERLERGVGRAPRPEREGGNAEARRATSTRGVTALLWSSGSGGSRTCSAEEGARQRARAPAGVSRRAGGVTGRWAEGGREGGGEKLGEEGGARGTDAPRAGSGSERPRRRVKPPPLRSASPSPHFRALSAASPIARAGPRSRSLGRPGVRSIPRGPSDLLVRCERSWRPIPLRRADREGARRASLPSRSRPAPCLWRAGRCSSSKPRSFTWPTL